jgi:Bacterial pre-peptidase C-terminal domain
MRCWDDEEADAMTITSRKQQMVGCAVLLLALCASAEAGGPLVLRAPGQPFLWPNGGLNIPFNPDQGGLGPLTNAAAVAQTTAAFTAWEAIASATATHVNAGSLAFDVDDTNFAPFLSPTMPDGLSAIVYDADGAIFTLLFGSDSGVLGFAGPEWINVATGVIVEGVGFMNGGALLAPSPFPVAEMLAVQVHEFGHYQNLAHTVVNGQAAGFDDTTGPTPFDTFALPASFAGLIETMYPFLFANGGQETPHADDIAIFSALYPAPTFAASTATITGRVIAPNSLTPVTGVNVIARNVLNPFDDAVSAISSDFATDYTPGAPLVGRYTLRGLTPGANYAVFVDQILAGAFSTPPRVLPGPEEFYSGASESNDIVADAPNVFAPVSASAGATATGIDIIFNRLLPGPLPLNDDSSFELFPEFPLVFCGRTYESVTVNANGNLTFGAPSSGLLETAAGMLIGPPRIAALWDDLNPEMGGVVSFAESSRTLTVTFSGVPEYPSVGANSFSITLYEGGPPGDPSQGGRFSLDYGAISALDGLAGYSCGGKTTSGFELETDFSALSVPLTLGLETPAVYEVFTLSDNDLDDLRFEVQTPRAFRDLFEPNNVLPTGTAAFGSSQGLVTLPFTTVSRYSAIEPLGGDVDFYRFRARAGEILALETLPGSPMDTMLGLFDAAGNLLALDDDGGVGGVGALSRILVRVPADGVYAVGVTTWPDFGFVGAGSDYGRYVLNISTYRGSILPMSDDGMIEVPLTTFTFPFQGRSWSSVWVNGNGNLTFGAGDDDFSETVGELLSGPPRIAPLWDDLSPANLFTGALQGLVIAEHWPGKLLVHFVSVPEFERTGTNYFTVELGSKGDVTMAYGATNRSDGLVGVTEGEGAGDPGPADLSRAKALSAAGTTYERFLGSFGTYGGVDLSFTLLTFRKP